MATYLDEILEWHRQLRPEGSPSSDLIARARSAGPTRGMHDALAEHRMAVIAEIKRRSPSKGALNKDLDPAALASDYERGGAAALSVLTDERFFGGSEADLIAARDAVALPVLRKDFTTCEHDVYEARAMGADAVLLIVAALSMEELERLHALSNEMGMDALVEVHDERELEQALAVGANLVGVNQRDLHTFEVDTGRAVRLGKTMPPDVLAVAESGIRGAQDVSVLAEAGYRAVLVGESLVTSDDPVTALERLGATSELFVTGSLEGA